MKKVVLLLLTLMLSISTVKAQDDIYYKKKVEKVPESENPQEYRNDSVITVPGVTSDILYLRLREHAVKIFKNSNVVIQIDDENKKRMVGSYRYNYSSHAFTRNYLDGYIEVTFELIARDGRFRYTCSTYRHTSTLPKQMQNCSCGIIYTSIPIPCPTTKTTYKNLILYTIPSIREEYERMCIELEKAAQQETTIEEEW